MGSVLELLVEAKALIEDESKWARGYYARGKNGELREPTEDGATCFCSIGALMKVLNGYDYPESLQIDRAERVLNKCVGGNGSIIGFNDDRSNSHEDVMAVWDKAIELERSGWGLRKV